MGYFPAGMETPAYPGTGVASVKIPSHSLVPSYMAPVNSHIMYPPYPASPYERPEEDYFPTAPNAPIGGYQYPLEHQSHPQSMKHDYATGYSYAPEVRGLGGCCTHTFFRLTQTTLLDINILLEDLRCGLLYLRSLEILKITRSLNLR